MSKKRKHIKNESGFTLVELMVTVLLTAIAVISIYRGYTAFSQSADAQQQVMEMQQNLRIGMTRLVTDIRRAGLNEEYNDVAAFMCEEIPTNATSIEFSMDLLGGDNVGEDDDDDGLLDEDDESIIGDGFIGADGEGIKYFLDSDEDIDGDGVLDPGEDLNGNKVLDQWLIRAVWDADKLPTPGYVDYTLITNVDALNFVYFDQAGGQIVPSAPPVGRCDGVDPADPVLSQRLSLYGDQLQKVDRVEITLVVRATNEDYRYTNREIYRNLQDEQVWPPPPPAPPLTPDNFRRRAFSMSVQIRNNI